MTVQENRERQKEDKLEYLYLAEGYLGVCPLLGSCMRAIGKGWKTRVLVDEQFIPCFLPLKGTIKGDFFNVIPAEKIDLESLASSAPDLVLMHSSNPDQVKKVRDSLIGKCHIMVSLPEDRFAVEYDLVSKFNRTELDDEGAVSFTGNGKGKSTGAYGMAVQDIFSKKRIAIVQWFKEAHGTRGTWNINEHNFPNNLSNRELVAFYPMGLGFFGSPGMDRVKGQEAYQRHKESAKRGLDLAIKLISSGDYSTIVLDEFIDTIPEVAGNIEYPLLELRDVTGLLKESNNSGTQIILTGRKIIKEIEPHIMASCIIKEVKHPYSSRRSPAVSGLDL